MTDRATEDLRPASLSEFVGQERLLNRLEPFLLQSLTTSRPLPHVFLTSAPGMGKTTLANAIANALGDEFFAVDFSSMQPKQLASFFRRFEGGIVFADEAQMMKAGQQEAMLTLLEEGYIATPHGGRIEVPWLTVIAATTHPEKIEPAFLARFPLRLEYDTYSDAEIAEMVAMMASKADLKIRADDAMRLAEAACGVPRTARDLVLAWRALTHAPHGPSVEAALDIVGLEEDGIPQIGLRYLRTLDDLEGTAGERVLSNLLNIHPRALQSVERILFAKGYVVPTPQGRSLTARGDQRLRGQRPTPGRRRVSREAV